jgi:hypothetical protein
LQVAVVAVVQLAVAVEQVVIEQLQDFPLQKEIIP